jgi:hypothetical protein
MVTYSTQKLLDASAAQIPQIAEAIRKDFADNGFEVYVDTLMSGGRDISITKGNLFKAILGMRSALKITLTPRQSGVFFDANVGIYGQQAIPTVISMLFFWPVLITQIWGLVEQSKLDDRALALAEQATGGTRTTAFRSSLHKFCTSCGVKLDTSSKFCSNCGARLE